MNQRQLAIALSNGDLIYFEIDQHGILVEIAKDNLENEVICLDIPVIPEGRQRSKFLAIGLSD